jgi:hypothetical protein
MFIMWGGERLSVSNGFVGSPLAPTLVVLGAEREELTASEADPSTLYSSVVVMAWQRRDFLETAIALVLARTPGRTEHGILGAKEWTDERIDGSLGELGAYL